MKTLLGSHPVSVYIIIYMLLGYMSIKSCLLYIHTVTNITCIEWKRVLQFGGYLFVSVPNIEVLYTLLLKPTYPENVRTALYSMVYGGQTDAYNYHIVSILRYIISYTHVLIYIYVYIILEWI